MEANTEPKRNWRLERRAHLFGGEVAFDVFGEGPAIVLVHGTPSWSYLWRNVASRLAEEFTVYVLDLPGYGDSEKREGQDLSIAAHSRVLTELLEEWQLESPAIAGHDIGGAVVLRTHLLDEIPFSHIALIDAVAVNPWVTPTTAHVQNHMDAYLTMPTHIYEEVVGAHLRTAVHRPMDEATFEAYMGQWRGKEGQAAYLRKVAQFGEEDVAELSALLGSIQAPVRIIWGQEDRWLDPGIAHSLQEMVSGAEVEVIPDAGHFVMEDSPERVAKSMGEFFAGEDERA